MFLSLPGAEFVVGTGETPVFVQVALPKQDPSSMNPLNPNCLLGFCLFIPNQLLFVSLKTQGVKTQTPAGPKK